MLFAILNFALTVLYTFSKMPPKFNWAFQKKSESSLDSPLQLNFCSYALGRYVNINQIVNNCYQSYLKYLLLRFVVLVYFISSVCFEENHLHNIGRFIKRILKCYLLICKVLLSKSLIIKSFRLGQKTPKCKIHLVSQFQNRAALVSDATSRW